MQIDLRRALAPASDFSAGVLIQGERGSFHHRATELLLPGVDVVPMASFPALASRLEAGSRQLGLMAIENSVAGALLTNYLLIEQHDLRIVAEIYLRISHSLMAPPTASIADLRTVESHPMALAQCRGFFAANTHLRPVEAYDTAGGAEIIARAADPHRAALAPIWCAAPLGLQVLAEAVEDSPHNWTRFVLVRHRHALSTSEFDVEASAAKSSVAFSLAHDPGSLALALTALAEKDCSLTKIQSLPIVGEPWAYRIFADYLRPEGLASSAVLHTLGQLTRNLTHLGDYAEGQHHQPT